MTEEDGTGSGDDGRSGGPPSRRRLLAALGVGAAGVGGAWASATYLSGTESAGRPATDAPADVPTATPTHTPTPTASPEPSPTPTATGPYYVANRHTSPTTVDPMRVQYNPTNPDHWPDISHHLLFEPFAQYNYARDRYEPAAMTDWGVTDGAFELTLRDDLTWSDGEDVTAADVVTQLRIARHDGDRLWEWATGVEAVDEYTTAITFDGSINPAVAERDVLHRLLMQDESTYGEWLAGLEGGERTVAQLRSFADRDPLVNGPFDITNKSESLLLTEHRGDDANPWGDNINFGEYAFERLGAERSTRQALLNLAVDSVHELPVESAVASQFPESIAEVQIPDLFGLGLAPNFDHPHAGDRAVRQAIAHVVDRRACVENAFPHFRVVPTVPTGIATDAQERWLGDRMADFETYGPDSRRTERAAHTLREAGYERFEGTWRDGQGRPVEVPVTVPAGWTDWTLAVETAVDHLSEFGFESSVRETTDYFETIRNPDEFVLVANTWLHGGPTPYPYFSLVHQLHEPRHHACHTGYPGYTEQYGGREATRTVTGPDGEDLTVDVVNRLADLWTATRESTAGYLVGRLALLANRDLPRIPISQRRRQQWLTTDDWEVPDPVAADPDAHVTWAPTWLLRRGKLRYDESGAS